MFLHPKAAKALEKINEHNKARIKKTLKELGDKPDKAGEALRYSDFWSLRIGDYCAIYEIDKAKNQVVMLFIGHRKNVHDDFTKLFYLSGSSLKSFIRIVSNMILFGCSVQDG